MTVRETQRVGKTQHDGLVVMMCSHFIAAGCTHLKADVQGYERPAPVPYGGRSYIPDLTCRKAEGRQPLVVLEAESASTIDDEHTAEQWRAFHCEARRVGGEFHIVVPRTAADGTPGREAVQRRLAELGIPTDEVVVWTPKA